jgi:hypothetical protein
MQPKKKISDQHQHHIMTNAQRRLLQGGVPFLIVPLIFWMGCFCFTLYGVMLGFSRNETWAALFLSVLPLGCFIFSVMNIYDLWHLWLDLRDGIIERTEGSAQLSIQAYTSKGVEHKTHFVKIGEQDFEIPQEVYLQLKDGHSYRIFYTRHRKIFMFAEFDSTTGQGTQTIYRADLPKSQNQLENLNIVDERAVKLKRDMADDYRHVLFQRFRRDTWTALVLVGVFGLSFMCTGIFFITVTPYQQPTNWLIFGLFCIPAVVIGLVLIYDYAQLYRDLREGTLETFDGRISLETGTITRYLHVIARHNVETKTFTISRERAEEFVEWQFYRVYFTPHSKIFVYAEKL